MTAQRGNALVEHSPTKVLKLKNLNCAYCGALFSDDLPKSLEHVVGRRFVPTGTMENVPNLHVFACEKCNGEKSQLEDDISVITMHPDIDGRLPVEDPRVRAEVARKAKTKNRRTGKPVAVGEDPFVVKGNLYGAGITFTFVAPPQVDEMRLYTLARFQIRAFLYMLTFRDQTGMGHIVDTDFFGVVAVRNADWGNPQLKWFEEETKDWLPRFHMVTADGFYKVWIKRKSDTEPVWAWALEWNKNFRLAGFAGQGAAIEPHSDKVPGLDLVQYHQEGGNWLRGRTEVQLAEENDTLFHFPERDPPTPDEQPA